MIKGPHLEKSHTFLQESQIKQFWFAELGVSNLDVEILSNEQRFFFLTAELVEPPPPRPGKSSIAGKDLDLCIHGQHHYAPRLFSVGF